MSFSSLYAVRVSFLVVNLNWGTSVCPDADELPLTPMHDNKTQDRKVVDVNSLFTAVSAVMNRCNSIKKG